MEGVVGGDQHPAIFGNPVDFVTDISVEGIKRAQVARRIGLVDPGMTGIEFRQAFRNVAHRLHPEGDIEPDVGIVIAGKCRRRIQASALDAVGHRHGLNTLLHFLEDLRHFTFQVEAVVKDHIRPRHAGDIPFAGLIKVRIDPRTHQGNHCHPLTPDIAHRIADHPGGRNHIDLPLRNIFPCSLIAVLFAARHQQPQD